MHHPDRIARPATESGSHNLGNIGNSDETSLHPAALEMLEAFHAARHRAQEALMLGQHFPRRSYNKGRLSTEFQEGDLVLLNLVEWAIAMHGMYESLLEMYYF